MERGQYPIVDLEGIERLKKMLDAYAEAGGNFIDTADAYSQWVEGNSGGESETIIGEWLSARGNREDVVLATKVGAHAAAPGTASVVSEGVAE